MQQPRIIITFREPYDKNYYVMDEVGELLSGGGAVEFFIIRFDPGTYTSTEMSDQGFEVAHEGGKSFYPWSAIQEIDYFYASQES